MSVLTRPATPADAAAMCDVINPLIALGDNTAHRTPFDAARMAHHYIAPKRGIASTVAEVDGQLVGFQALEWADPDWPAPDAHPSDWAVIASFVSPAAQGRGVGRALFAATRAAARTVGVAVIDATIRADNKAGLGYYTGLGFVDYAVTEALPLSDGTRIARIRKRYDLG